MTEEQREKRRLRALEYRAKNREKINAYNRKYNAEHKEELAVYRVKYNAENRAYIAERQRAYRRTHKEEPNERSNISNKKRYWQDPQYREQQLLKSKERNRRARELKALESTFSVKGFLNRVLTKLSIR